MRFALALALGAVLLPPAVLRAEEPKPRYEVIRLSETLHELRADVGGYVVKVLASVGPDGVLLVDTGQREDVPALLATLGRLGGGTPRIVVNSHHHTEHVAGNLGLGKGPLYIGHPRLRETLRREAFLFMGFDEDTIPRLTVADELSLHFNGEEIRVKAFPGAHDDSDLVVWFTKSRVAFVGALATACKFPTVDRLGDVLAYPDVTRRVLAWLPTDVKLVPGHGEDATMAQGQQFLEMLEKTTDLVRAELLAGKDLAVIQKEDLLKAWTSWEVGYVNRNRWAEYLVAGLTKKAAAAPLRKTLFEPMYAALQEKGPAGIAAAYAELKANHAAEYEFDEKVMAVIGYVLVSNGDAQKAVPFFELSLQDHPKGRYASLSHAQLGAVRQQAGDRAAAVAHYRKALELDPDNGEARRGLADLGEKS